MKKGVSLEVEVAALRLAVASINERLNNMEQIYNLIDSFDSFEQELRTEMENARANVMRNYDDVLATFKDLLKVGVDAAQKVQHPKIVDGLELISESAVESAELKNEPSTRGKRPWENTNAAQEKKPEFSKAYKMLVSGDLPKNNERESSLVENSKEIPEEKSLPDKTEEISEEEKLPGNTKEIPEEKKTANVKTIKIKTEKTPKPTSVRTRRSRTKVVKKVTKKNAN